MTTGEGTLTIPGGPLVGWRQAGDPSGRPLLWFHGGLSSSSEADFLHAAASAGGVRVIALDRPGIGDSSLWEMGTVARWPAVVLACAEQLGLERVHVAGWSAGGPYALACAWQLTERVEAVTLVAGMHPVSDPARRRELGLRTDRLLFSLSQRHPGVARALLEPYRRLPAASLWQLARSGAGPAEKAALTPEVRPAFTAMLRGAVRHGVGGVVADYRRTGAPWGFALADVATPVTVLQGTEDGMVPPAHADLLCAELGAATLHAIPGAGHFLPLTHAEEIIASLGG